MVQLTNDDDNNNNNNNNNNNVGQYTGQIWQCHTNLITAWLEFYCFVLLKKKEISAETEHDAVYYWHLVVPS